MAGVIDLASDEELLLVTGSRRLGETIPRLYRLARHKDGTLILQGACFWQDGNNYGHEWHEIPIVELGE